MTDQEFLTLKQRYYDQGYRGDLPVVTGPLNGKHPGTTNNREQNALRWGYDACVRDLKASVISFAEAMIHGSAPEGEEPRGTGHL